MLTKNKKIWNICVIFVTNNKPPCRAIPLVTTLKEAISFKIQYVNIIIAILLYRIEISRLKLTAFESKRDIIDIIIMA